ncbi:hypothetical protein AAG570_012310 [Ranatra chinensis]|uniref:Uncharacterized protein n=1 Tax=Ranatra chinensis TaxID=642074 RepID=A0ABD0YIF9_9HEMI
MMCGNMYGTGQNGEYPCDHYTGVINVTLMNTGCPRSQVQETALQLLQLLDKRFFGPVGPLPSEGETLGGTDSSCGTTKSKIMNRIAWVVGHLKQSARQYAKAEYGLYAGKMNGAFYHEGKQQFTCLHNLEGGLKNVADNWALAYGLA